MATDWSKYIIPVGCIVLGYYILEKWGVIGPTCDPTCTQCPKGSSYSQLIGGCDNNYTPCGFFHENCCCDCCVSLSLEDMGYEPIPIYELTYLRELVDSL